MGKNEKTKKRPGLAHFLKKGWSVLNDKFKKQNLNLTYVPISTSFLSQRPNNYFFLPFSGISEWPLIKISYLSRFTRISQSYTDR